MDWQRRGKLNRFGIYLNGQSVGCKKQLLDAAVFFQQAVEGEVSMFVIPCNRAGHLGKMDADLMHSSGCQLQPNEIQGDFAAAAFSIILYSAASGKKIFKTAVMWAGSGAVS